MIDPDQLRALAFPGIVQRYTRRDTVRRTAFCRGDGGFGGPPRHRARPPDPPDRPADAAEEIATLPQAALIWRLSGDLNPLHADPGFLFHADVAGQVVAVGSVA